MRTRYLLAAALLGGVVLFAWGALSHLVLVKSFPGAEPWAFAGSSAAVVLKQLGIEVLVAFVLGWLLLKLPAMGGLTAGGLLMFFAVAAGIEEQLSLANWSGRPTSSALFEFLDLVVGWLILGVVLGWLKNRMARGPGGAGPAA